MKTRMPRVFLQTLLLLLGVAAFTRAQGRIVEPADIIVVHGHVYTENPKQPWAQAVAIYRGKIVAVGDDPEIERRRGMGTKVINAGGKLVLPGIVDCHVHFLDGSLSLGRVNLEGSKDPADIQKRLREYAAQRPGDDWILGRGWNYAMFGPEALPHKKYLARFSSKVMTDIPTGQTRRLSFWPGSPAILRIRQTARLFATPKRVKRRVR